MYHLKRIILACLFVLVGFSAYAQTPTDRADFLTEKMNVLLNLSAEQVEPIRAASLDLFERELEMQEMVAQTPKAQLALADQLSPEMKEKVVNKLASAKANRLENYTTSLQSTLSEDQYSLYLQNQTALFQSVVDQFGE